MCPYPGGWPTYPTCSAAPAAATYKLSAVNQNCDDACQSLGSSYHCDRDETSALNTQGAVTAKLTQLVGKSCKSYDTSDCDAAESGWEGNVPFLVDNIHADDRCFFCSDTTKTLCSAKHQERQRMCACRQGNGPSLLPPSRTVLPYSRTPRPSCTFDLRTSSHLHFIFDRRVEGPYTGHHPDGGIHQPRHPHAGLIDFVPGR